MRQPVHQPTVSDLDDDNPPTEDSTSAAMLPHPNTIRRGMDQRYCPTCGKVWDTNDPDPPECSTPDDRARKAFRNIQSLLD